VIDTSSTEVVDAHLVPTPEPVFKELAVRSLPPVAQTAAAAAGGFVAGAAMLGLVHRRHSKRAALAKARSPRRVRRGGKRSKSMGELMEVVATRTLLVDVHLLGPVGRDR
jgi:hypothetical protein